MFNDHFDMLRNGDNSLTGRKLRNGEFGEAAGMQRSENQELQPIKQRSNRRFGGRFFSCLCRKILLQKG